MLVDENEVSLQHSFASLLLQSSLEHHLTAKKIGRDGKPPEQKT